MSDQANIINSVVVPMLNANEDELTVVDVCVKEGDQVANGQLLFVVESTKTTSDVLNTAAGYVRNIAFRNGDLAAVGATLCVIVDRADGPIAGTEPAAKSVTVDSVPNRKAPSAGPTLATSAASALATQHNVNLTALGLDRIITERDIRSFLGLESTASPESQPTVLPFASRNTNDRPYSTPGTMPPQLVIFGAGGHAGALIELIRVSRPEVRIVAAVDDAPGRTGHVLGVPIVGSSSELTRLREEGVRYAGLGVGAATNPQLRKQLFDRLTQHGFELPSFVHPDSRVEATVTMGTGNQIFSGATVGTSVKLGNNTLINCGCVISHDCVIGSHSHITPGAVLAGAVSVGENSTIGMGCTVFLGKRIGDEVIIGNGIHVFDDVADGTFLRPKKTAHRAA